jgi:hypothetical protein
VYVQFVEVSHTCLEYFNVCEADWAVVSERDPQVPLATRPLEGLARRCLRENRFRRVTHQQARGSELDGREHGKVSRPSGRDEVRRVYRSQDIAP